MTPGNLLVYLTLVFTIAGIVLSILRLKTKDPVFSLYSRLVTVLVFVLVSISTLYLYVLFITSDMSNNYVWQYSKTTLPLIYKISGVLAGKAGSLLFWIWMTILPWFYEEIKARKHNIDNDLLHWTRLMVFIVLTVLVSVLIQHDLFGLTSPGSLALAPTGNGLSPLLQTPLMAIHPPIVFVAYGFLVMPFASGLASLITGDRKWVDLSLNWGRAGWFFLTLGIGIGGLWAYVVLGWGGYWAWDPVETSSLLPWLLLTAVLHAQLMFKRKGDYPLLAPVTGIMTYVLVIFATFATRAGGLWVSVHTFGEADTSINVWTRLFDILTENVTLLVYMVFIIACIVITVILLIYRYRKTMGDKKEKYYTLSELLSDNILMTLMVYLTILTTIVTLIILIRGVNGLGPDEFNAQVGVLVFIGVLVLILCLMWRSLGRKWVTILSVSVLIASAIGFLFFPEHRAVASSMPLLMVALVGTGYRVFKSFNVKKAWRSMSVVSAHLIHLSIILILMGYVTSNFMVTEENVTTPVTGGEAIVGAYTLNVVDAELSQINQTLFLEIDVWKGNKFIGKVRPGVQIIDGQLRNEIMIADTLTEDVYIIYDYDQARFSQGMLDLHVKILPLMKFVWGGMWLMSVAIVLRYVVERTTRRKTGAPTEAVEKDDEYYASLLDSQLDDMDKGPVDPGDEPLEEDEVRPVEDDHNEPDAEEDSTIDEDYEARLEEELLNADSE